MKILNTVFRASIFLFSSSLFAMPITFDLRDSSIEAIDEVNSFSLTLSGITATLSALPSTWVDNTGVTRNLLLNRTSRGFGVNVDGVANTKGCSTEDSDGIDDGCIVEGIKVDFTQAYILESFRVSSFGSTDEGVIDFFEPGLTDISVTSTGTTAAGQTTSSFTLWWVAGNGFSFDSFTVSAVPEPTVIALFGLGLFSLWLVRRKRLTDK